MGITQMLLEVSFRRTTRTASPSMAGIYQLESKERSTTEYDNDGLLPWWSIFSNSFVETNRVYSAQSWWHRRQRRTVLIVPNINESLLTCCQRPFIDRRKSANGQSSSHSLGRRTGGANMLAGARSLLILPSSPSKTRIGRSSKR
jgi:hypothetical protein